LGSFKDQLRINFIYIRCVSTGTDKIPVPQQLPKLRPEQFE
jgi:hypothetical protein